MMELLPVRPPNEDAPEGEITLQALQLIQTVGDKEPFSIVPVSYQQGTAMPAHELMAAKVKWANRAGYRVLPVEVPGQFAPYNAVIRVNEGGTEDHMLDYLAYIAATPPVEASQRSRSLRSGANRMPYRRDGE